MPKPAHFINIPLEERKPGWIWAFYSVAAFLAFSPCLILGKAYFDNDLLAQFGPWRTFLKNQLSQGHFPLWNPYSLGGQPFFADLQNMMLYPFNYLTLPFSVPYGLGVFFFLHLFWSAVGTHLWLRSLNLSEMACRVGALLFAFSNFFWLELIHPPVLAAFSWLPWFFGSLERLVQNPRPRTAFFSGLTFAMLFLCGSFQVSLGAFYGGLAYFLFRFWPQLATRMTSRRVQSAAILSLFVLWGALPLLGQFIPTLEFSSRSDRGSAPQAYDTVNSNWPLHPQTLYQFLFPRFNLPENQTMAEAVQYRNSPQDVTTNFLGTMGYMGIWIPLLAFSAFRKKNKTLPTFLSLFSLIVLAVCFGNYLPVHRFFCAVLPGFSLIRVPYRFLFLYVLGVSALAAFGFEQWFSKTPARGKTLDRLKIPLAYGLALYLAALFRPSLNWREILAITLGMAGLLAWFAGKKWSSLLAQTALILPLFLNGWADFIPSPSSNFDFGKNSKSLNEIAERARPYRLIFDNSHMSYPIEVQGKSYFLNYPQNAACALGIKNFGGYNPLMLQAKRDIGAMGMDSLVRLGAIKGVLTQQNHGDIPGFKLESFPPYLFYEYQKPLSYVYAPTYVLVMTDAQKRLEALGRPDFDISKTIIFSEMPDFEIKPPHQTLGSHLSYQLVKDGADEQSFTIDMDGTHWLVFPEVNYPGWKAWSDGRPVQVFTADHLLRSILLSAGHHQVEFRFEPDWLLPLQAGLVLWLLITLGFLVRGPIRARRK